MERGYGADRYWSRRLERDFSLRGTGHISYSESYNAWLYRAKRRALRRALCDVPGDRPVALDAGSGSGWVVGELLRFGATVDGCDIAEVAVERLRRLYPEGRFFQVTLGSEPLPSADASYDLVTALDVCYHITDDRQWEAAVDELARVLRPGGRLIVTDGLGDEGGSPAPHVRFRSAQRWRRVAESRELRLIALRPLYRWLSRDRDAAGFRHLPDRLRGPLEYVLEVIAPRRPHMRCAVFASLPGPDEAQPTSSS